MSAHLSRVRPTFGSVELSFAGSSGFMQDLACVLRVLRANHDVVRPHGAQPVSSPGPAVRQPGQALDARATQDRAEQLGLGLATGDLDYDPVVHLGYPNVNTYASAPGSRKVISSVRSRTASC